MKIYILYILHARNFIFYSSLVNKSMCLIPYVKIDVFAYFTYDTNCFCFVKMYILYSLPVGAI